VLEDCSIALHDITRCGYRPRGADNIVFGRLDELLADVVDWARPKTLGETSLIAMGAGQEGMLLMDDGNLPSLTQRQMVAGDTG